MKKSFKDYLKLGITVAVTAVMCAMTASSVFAADKVICTSTKYVLDPSVSGAYKAQYYNSDATFNWKGADRDSTYKGSTTGIYDSNGNLIQATDLSLFFAGNSGTGSIFINVKQDSRLVYSLYGMGSSSSIYLYNVTDYSVTSPTTSNTAGSGSWTLSESGTLLATPGSTQTVQGDKVLSAGTYAIKGAGFRVVFLALDPIDNSVPFGTVSNSAEQYAAYPKLEKSGSDYVVKINRNFKEGCVISEIGVILADNTNASAGNGYKLKYYSITGTVETGTYDFTVRTETNAPKKIQAYITYKLGDNDTKTVYSNIIEN